VRLTIAIEFSAKRENAILMNKRLQQEAQPILDIIENPSVAQALHQDNSQNLQYLKDNYNVRSVLRYHYLALTPNL
jgi:translation initiation factor 3 subunit E